MRIPPKEKCYELICETRMMTHIAAHSIRVCQVAVTLTDRLMDAASATLNRELIQAAALLHDITKTRSIRTREDHALTGDLFLRERGYAEVGEIVAQHVRLNAYTPSAPITEAELVNYADKRVLHDEVASLRERLDYTLERYGKNPEILERILWTWHRTKELEAKIFENLSFSPEELPEILRSEEFSHEVAACQDICDGCPLVP